MTTKTKSVLHEVIVWAFRITFGALILLLKDEFHEYRISQQQQRNDVATLKVQQKNNDTRIDWLILHQENYHNECQQHYSEVLPMIDKRLDERIFSNPYWRQHMNYENKP